MSQDKNAHLESFQLELLREIAYYGVGDAITNFRTWLQIMKKQESNPAILENMDLLRAKIEILEAKIEELAKERAE